MTGKSNKQKYEARKLAASTHSANSNLNLNTKSSSSSSSTSTERNGSAKSDSIRSRSPIEKNRATSTVTKPPTSDNIMKDVSTDSLTNLPNSINPRPTLTKTATGQAGSVNVSASVTAGGTPATAGLKVNPMVTADKPLLQTSAVASTSNAPSSAATGSGDGDDELVVDNDESFPDDADMADGQLNLKKRKRPDTEPASTSNKTEIATNNQKSNNWTQVNGKNKVFKIPKNSQPDLRDKLPPKQQQHQPPSQRITGASDLRQQLQHQQQHQMPPKSSYANVTRKQQQQPPQPTLPWNPLELRVFCSTFRHAPMNQATWQELSLQIMGAVQNEMENEDIDAEDLEIIVAKKLWWHAKLECGVVEVYTRAALEWFKRLINSFGSNTRAWSAEEKPEPRLKIWIKPQFAHITTTKYIQLCLRFHPELKGQQWKVESVSEEEGNRRTVYIRTTPLMVNYLQREGGNTQDKFTIRGFCGDVSLAMAKEAPLSSPLPNSLNNTTSSPSTTPTPASKIIAPPTTATAQSRPTSQPEISPICSPSQTARRNELPAAAAALAGLGLAALTNKPLALSEDLCSEISALAQSDIQMGETQPKGTPTTAAINNQINQQ